MGDKNGGARAVLEERIREYRDVSDELAGQLFILQADGAVVPNNAAFTQLLRVDAELLKYCQKVDEMNKNPGA
jgi:hypothetical protein